MLPISTRRNSNLGSGQLLVLGAGIGIATWALHRVRSRRVMWDEDPQDTTGGAGFVAVVLAAGFGTRFQKDLVEDRSGQFSHLLGTPKPLLPLGDRCILDHWVDQFNACTFDIKEVFVVTNAVVHEKFQTWASRSGFGESNLVNDNTTHNNNRLGACGDMQFVLDAKRKQIGSRDVIFVAGDTVLGADFDLGTFLQSLPAGDNCVCHYPITSNDEVLKRGVVEIDEHNVVTRFMEKPLLSSTRSRLGCPALYVIRAHTLPLIRTFLEERTHSILHERDAPGQLLEWLVSRARFSSIPITHHFKIDTLREYKVTLNHFSPTREVVEAAHARIGLLGNPSDGYNGKTISVLIDQFCAQVTVRESSTITLIPNTQFDRETFSSLDELTDHTDLAGYYGGLRLMRATCKKFCELCRRAGVPRPKPFTMSYNSSIPFACGMSGSSAIITASFKALMRYANLNLADLGLTKPLLPNIILSIEKDELGIAAGLQDRVIQVYEGVVFMDFAESLFQKDRHGKYEYIPAELLPPLYLAYLTKPGGDSGKIHSTVKKRFEQGDVEVRNAMVTFAEIAQEGRAAVMEGNCKTLAQLMDQNFQLRRKIFGEAALGPASLRMIQLANQFNFSAKFTGSGGAIVCLYRGDGSTTGVGSELSSEKEKEVRHAFLAENFGFCRVTIHTPTPDLVDLFGERI